MTITTIPTTPAEEQSATPTHHVARRSSPSRRRRYTAMSLVLLLTAALVGVSNTPASAAYQWYSSDWFNFNSSNSAVNAYGYVNWYKDGLIAPVYRGEYDAYVVLQRSGCLYAKVSWTTLTGSVSWPPSGGATTTSDGFYRKCGAAGTYLSLRGQAHASRTLARSCLTIGYSSNSSQPRSFQSSQCMWS